MFSTVVTAHVLAFGALMGSCLQQARGVRLRSGLLPMGRVIAAALSNVEKSWIDDAMLSWTASVTVLPLFLINMAKRTRVL
jgi:hypothetical protein